MTLNVMNAIQSIQIKKQNAMLKQEHKDNTVIHYDDNVKIKEPKNKNFIENSIFTDDWLKGIVKIEKLFEELEDD